MDTNIVDLYLCYYNFTVLSRLYRAELTMISTQRTRSSSLHQDTQKIFLRRYEMFLSQLYKERFFYNQAMVIISEHISLCAPPPAGLHERG